MTAPWIHSWIKTSCGRAKYAELQSKRGIIAQIRLLWFILWAVIRDFNLSNTDQNDDSESES